MLVATAGHIDHGKTSLIRALTGVETDRLPEERARGISIDLGFAYWQPGDGPTIGFVDVPGHERYVRNMLAGASGVDFALVVVAADDGVMPQTIEHVQILDLLNIRHGVVAITKCDRSSQERIAEVRQQLKALLSNTTLADAPMFEVSTTAGTGIAALADALRAANVKEQRRATPDRNFSLAIDYASSASVVGTLDPNLRRAIDPAFSTANVGARDRSFRLAIDRAFSVSGVGTVVTGTVRDGAVEVGTHLILAPSGVETRIRSLQSAGQVRTQVRAGERCAINLTNVEVAQIHRGDWLLLPAMYAPTTRIAVHLKVLDTRVLKHNTPVHLHLGTADIPARVLLSRQAAVTSASVTSAAEPLVQLVLDHPTCAVVGDRLVLRDHSGRLLIGGGTIVDPLVPTERRKQSHSAEISAALQLAEPAATLAALLAIPGYEVDTVNFERRINLTPAAAETLYRDAGAVMLATSIPLAVPASRIAEITDSIVDSLKTFHHEHPDARGMSAHQIKASLTPSISTAAFLAVQKMLIAKRIIETSGSVLKLPGYTVSFSAADDERWHKVQRLVQNRGALSFSPSEAAADAKISEPVMKAMLYRRRGSGDVWRIDEQRFMLRDQVAALAARAAALAKDVGGRGFTVAQYRDATGIGRNHVIRLLEFFDSIGVTRRDGDCRKVPADYHLVVGSAAPYRHN
jgi:selenocysteine-specific elongation factor